MLYPNTNVEIRLGDPVWINEGKWLTRVVRLIETENDRRNANVEENGFYFSYEASKKTKGSYGFMPYRLMGTDLCYRATEEELFGIRIILYRLFTKYRIDKKEAMYSISTLWPRSDGPDGLEWRIGITESGRTCRRFVYSEWTDEYKELPSSDFSFIEDFSWALT